MNQPLRPTDHTLLEFGISNESGKLLLVCGNSTGFFVDRSLVVGLVEFNLGGCLNENGMMSSRHWAREISIEMEISILRAGRKLGAYTLTNARLVDVAEQSESTWSLTLAGNMSALPRAIDEHLWKERIQDGPAEKNTWVRYTDSDKGAWLRIARMASRYAENSSGLTFQRYLLDGSFVENETSFYCAFGEAINGPGGYFGQGLDSLADCCGGGFGPRAPFAVAGWSTIDGTHAWILQVREVLESKGVELLD
jgi:hypothetical protein